MSGSGERPTHVIIWEFRARRGREGEFERVYGPDGDWANFFRRGEGYLGTELMHDVETPGRYVTIDRWTSAAAYEDFRSRNLSEYETIDRRCESLTEHEAHLGSLLTMPGDGKQSSFPMESENEELARDDPKLGTRRRRH